LSQRIIRDHGGTIVVQSELGKGATFTITLPAIDESVPVESIDGEQPAPDSTYAAASAAPPAASSPTIRR
jgi:hypothetical protein